MKLDQLINQLQTARKRCGNVKVCTWDGTITKVDVTPSENGIQCSAIFASEVVIDIQTKAE